MVKIYIKNEEEMKKFVKEYPNAKVFHLPKSMNADTPLACKDEENPGDGHCLVGEEGIRKIIESEKTEKTE